MQLIAQLADADAYAVICKVRGAHLDQIGDSLPGGTAKERHAPQILRRTFHDIAIAGFWPRRMTAVFDLESLDADCGIVAAVPARHTKFKQRP